MLQLGAGVKPARTIHFCSTQIIFKNEKQQIINNKNNTQRHRTVLHWVVICIQHRSLTITIHLFASSSSSPFISHYSVPITVSPLYYSRRVYSRCLFRFLFLIRNKKWTLVNCIFFNFSFSVTLKMKCSTCSRLRKICYTPGSSWQRLKHQACSTVWFHKTLIQPYHDKFRSSTTLNTYSHHRMRLLHFWVLLFSLVW